VASKQTISAVLIVKDEEAVLDACLESVAWADEIVVYDTGSTDRTVEIARRHTDVVVQGYWDDSFAAARNRALEHATSEWSLTIDADEVFDGDHVRMRRHLGRNGATAHSLIIRNVLAHDRLPLGLQVAHTDTSGIRVFLTQHFRYAGTLHEQPMPRPGVVGRLEGLPNVHLRHSGYTQDVMASKNKAERNVTLASALVRDGRRDETDPREQQAREVHLARSLGLARRFTEALALADDVVARGLEEPRLTVILAVSAVEIALATGDGEAAYRWLQVWEDHDTNPAFARAARARAAAALGDADVAVEALDGIPTTTLGALGERLDRAQLARIEMWARSAVGQGRKAARAACDAAARGVSPGTPVELAAFLGHDRAVTVIGALTDSLWREYVTWCVMAARPEATTFLRWMHEVRPGDVTVLGGIALLAPTLALEDAALWAVDFRRVGLADQCPLVAIALDERADARQRALAGALALSAYGDERALPGLEAALERVDDADAAELLAHLEVLAPGLVTAGASA